MKNINDIDLSKGLEVQKFAKELVAENEEWKVVSFDNYGFDISADTTACCGDDIDDGNYEFCVEDEQGYIYDVYCGSKCYLREYNFANRFNENWTMITKEQFDMISENC